MKYLKEKPKKGNTGLVIAVVVLSIAVVVLLALLLWSEPWERIMGTVPSGTSQPTETAEPVQSETVSAETQTMQATEAAAVDFAVETPYCTLRFPAQWQGQVTASVNEYEGGCAAAFVGTVDGREAYLFVILLEEGGNQGNAVGSVTAEDGTTAWVYVELNELLLDDSWSQDQADTLLAMQEGLNDLLNALKRDAAFTAAN